MSTYNQNETETHIHIHIHSRKQTGFHFAQIHHHTIYVYINSH